MLHTNEAELRLLFNTFTRVWSSGGQANLSLQTKDNQMWAKLDLQLGPADGHRPGPPVAGERAGAQPPQVRRKGPATRARDARRRQEWQERRKEPALELPTSQAQEPRIQPVSDPEQEDQEVLLIAKCPNPTTVVEIDKEIPDDNSDVIPQLDGPAEKASDTIVTLELNDIGDITGPELAPNSSPPARVFHPTAGIGILYREPPDPTEEDSFYSYIFPNDPNAYVVKQGPGRGQKMESIMEVFECN
jgi:hypothetical protein